MYTNTAYLGKKDEDIVDSTRELLVTAAGYFRIHTSKVFETERPDGRGDYQLLYVAAGKAHFYFNGQKKIVEKGNMILFRPGEEQIYYIYSADRPETYWVHFTGAEVEKLLDYYKMPRGQNVFFTGTSPDYEWIFRQMIRELQLKRKNYADMLNISLRQIFLTINRYIEEKMQIKSDLLNEIEKAIHYFLENYNREIIIKDYAKEHLMTPCWFIQNFKQVTKMTPMQYIVKLRMTSAMNLMENSKYTIKQISALVGYDNPLYFSKHFKKYTGVSPTEYRKQSEAQ